MWSFPFVGISLASSGSRIDIDKICFEGKYPKNLCIGCFSVPFCIAGTGGLCSKLDTTYQGKRSIRAKFKKVAGVPYAWGWDLQRALSTIAKEQERAKARGNFVVGAGGY